MSAAVFRGAPSSQRQRSAEVTGIDEHGNLTYRFDNATLSFQGTQGAPILNKDGKVVADIRITHGASQICFRRMKFDGRRIR